MQIRAQRTLAGSREAERSLRLDPVSIPSSGLIRTAYTPSVKEYHDFCSALFDVKALRKA